jgi:hypothetical protein
MVIFVMPSLLALKGYSARGKAPEVLLSVPYRNIQAPSNDEWPRSGVCLDGKSPEWQIP